MTTKKTGLGKGLDALFSSQMFEETFNNNTDDDVVKKIRINEIEPNKSQARKFFDDESIEDLSNSIKEYGVIQPIIVSKKKGYYEIIAGERRWRASKKARGIKVLMDEYNLTQASVAEKLGKSRSSIANTVRLLNLDERVINLALEGKLTEGHCKTLMSIEDPDKQFKMANYIIESGDSVRDAEKRMKNKKKAVKKNNNYMPIYRDIENTFQEFFGTKVKLDAGEKKGKIIIQYSSNDDLERIMSLIK